MKVILSKDHLNNKAGDEIDVTEERARYFERVGLTGELPEKKEVKHKKKKKK